MWMESYQLWESQQQAPSTEKIKESIKDCQLKCYYLIGIKPGRDWYDPHNTAIDNFAKGIIDEIASKLWQVIAMGNVSMDKILEWIQRLNFREILQDIIRDITDFSANTYEFGKKSASLVIQTMWYTALLAKIAQKMGKIHGMDAVENNAERLRNIATLWWQTIKDRLKDYMRSHPTFWVVSNNIYKADQFVRSKIHPNMPEYVAITSALWILTQRTLASLDHSEAYMSLWEESNAKKLLDTTLQEYIQLVNKFHIDQQK